MSIQEHLNKIRNAIYGREVRESIAKGIETAYDDAIENGNTNMEVRIARGTHPNLRSRLEEVDDKQQQTTAQLAQKVGNGKKASLEDLESEVLSAIEGGGGTSFDLLSIPQDNSVTPEKFSSQLRNDLTFPAQNLITNGRFENDYTPWGVGVTTGSVRENKLFLDFNSTSTTAVLYPGERKIGHKYYGRLDIERLSGSFEGLSVFIGGVGDEISLPLQNKITHSGIKTATSVGGSFLQLSFTIPTADLSVALERPLFIDLTETFGAGNEPTIEEFEEMLSQFPNSWFDGTKQIMNFKNLTISTMKELRNKANIEDLVDAGEVTLNDLDNNNTANVSLGKKNNEISMSWEEKSKGLNLDSIAYGNVSFYELFSERNIIQNSHFNGDMTGYTISTGSPTISTEEYNTPSKSLKLFGNTSQYVSSEAIPNTKGKKYFVAAKVKVNRYSSGGGIGFRINSPTSSFGDSVKEVTDEFETISTVFTADGSEWMMLLGSIASSDADGYLDDFMVVDISDLPESMVENTTMERLYDLYLDMLKGQTASAVVKKNYKIATEEKSYISKADAQRAFVTAMNEKAQEIGMSSSNFTDAIGGANLDQMVTAKELLLMGVHASGYDEILKVWNKKGYTLNILGNSARKINISTTVKDPALEDSYYIFGGKTGTVDIQGRNVKNLLVVVDAPNDNWFIGAVLNADDNRFEAAKSLFDIAKLYIDEGYSGTHDIGASKAAVALMPKHNPLAYAGYDIPLLWGKNEDMLEAPASTTKVMSAMVMLDYVSDLNEKIQIKASDISLGSGPVMKDGDIITFKDALYAMLLPSANTIASAVQRIVGEKIIRSKLL